MPHPRLATRLMQAQVIVVAVSALTLMIAAAIVAPPLFHDHLIDAGVSEPEVQRHAQEAFTSAFAIAVILATLAALVAAIGVSWFMVRRVSRPVEELAQSARALTAGHYDVPGTHASFSRELHQLSNAFTDMAARLSKTEVARTRFLSDLAHELRTPLATLEAYIDGLEDAVLAPDSAAYAAMRSQVDRLRRLAIDLRESSAAQERGLEISLEPIDLRDVTQAAITAAHPYFAAKHITLEYENPAQACWILGDSMRLQQVLANLLDNAQRHTPSGGTVAVSLESIGSDIELRIRDSGEGIPLNELSAVFERFHRVDISRISADGSGSGLGLTIARAIIKDHGGAIVATSDGLGTGATFVVTLPTAKRL